MTEMDTLLANLAAENKAMAAKLQDKPTAAPAKSPKKLGETRASETWSKSFSKIKLDDGQSDPLRKKITSTPSSGYSGLLTFLLVAMIGAFVAVAVEPTAAKSFWDEAPVMTTAIVQRTVDRVVIVADATAVLAGEAAVVAKGTAGQAAVMAAVVAKGTADQAAMIAMVATEQAVKVMNASRELLASLMTPPPPPPSKKGRKKSAK
mmetsp:Transcript_13237/g.33939  ORF Transcript_13237/g.33939 Transcript_13237/m.33939 type:complete len:206 (-) Transcript_13237:374-991(-)|eukprot:CAMPEP_0115863014 /NCGR_PEP_ID=MMETSP0287-20121206/18475_1 /TAXON_ID=412157 /ORGANISM="Chrysochromulina rotalis, Strain UIO044" /LENGTH=205 /DNA_ID=CAMNT_0003317457 /DNA_START=121 /DNA_END=738 /DNA_ORIENTATION=-